MGVDNVQTEASVSFLPSSFLYFSVRTSDPPPPSTLFCFVKIHQWGRIDAGKIIGYKPAHVRDCDLQECEAVNLPFVS